MSYYNQGVQVMLWDRNRAPGWPKVSLLSWIQGAYDKGWLNFTSLPPASISFSEIQNIGTNTILGRDTAGSGVIEELTLGSGLTLTSGVLDVNLTGYLKLDGTSTMGGALNMGTHLINNLVDPASAQDAATKNYVDNFVLGLSWKASVRAATTVAGTLATDFENGDIIDGVTLATGDRILIKNQATASANGIYVVAASGAPTRATDANTGSELVSATVLVQEGTVNAETQWTQSTNAPITIGSTSIVFAQVAGTGIYLPLAGGTMTGNLLIGSGASNSHNIQIGNTGNLQTTGTTISSILNIGRNVYHDGSNFKRLVADTDAPLIQLSDTGSFNFYGATDGQTTAGSTITYANRFNISTGGLITHVPSGITTGSGFSLTESSTSTGMSMSLTSTSTINTGTTACILKLDKSGAHAASSVTSYGLQSVITNTGTSSTNIAGYFSASGGTNNYAGIFDGRVGINTTTPAGALEIRSQGASQDALRITNAATGTLIAEYYDNAGHGELYMRNSSSTTQVLLTAAPITTGSGSTFSSSTVTSGSLLSITKTGTAALTGATGLNVSFSGANATGAQTTYAGQFSNTSTGTSVNYGAVFTASGGSTNYPLQTIGAGGGGFRFGAYTGSSTDGVIYANNVTPSTNNYAFYSNGAFSGINGTTSAVMYVNDTAKFTVSQATTGVGLNATDSSLTTGKLMSLSSTSTANTSTTSAILNISKSGAHVASSVTSYGQTINVVNTGTSSTNVGLDVMASGATNNYPLQVWGIATQGMLRVNVGTQATEIGDWTNNGFASKLNFLRPSGGTVATTISQGNSHIAFQNVAGGFQFTDNSAASQGVLQLTGQWYAAGTGTTTHPHFFIQPSVGATTKTDWSTAGTAIGVNAISGFAGDLMNLSVNGTTSYKLTSSLITGAFFYGTSTSETFPLTLHNTSTNAGQYTSLRLGTVNFAGTWGFIRSSLGAGGSSHNLYLGITNTNVIGITGTTTETTITNATFAPSSGSTAFSGLTLTGTHAATGAASGAYKPLNITYTINNTGTASTATATGIFLNATETALNSMTHNLMDLQVGGVSKFSISRTGAVVTGSTISIGGTVNLGAVGAGGNIGLIYSGGASIIIAATASTRSVNLGRDSTTGATTNTVNILGKTGIPIAAFYDGSDVLKVTVAESGRITSEETVITKGYTFATLPGSPVAGMRTYITDASADTPTYASDAAGGGTGIVPVFYTGTKWIFA